MFVSCSLFKNRTKDSPEKIWFSLWNEACPVSIGKGQIFLPKSTYAFSYESVFNEEENFWAMALDVPLRGEETLILPMNSEGQMSGSLLERVSILPTNLKVMEKNWVQMLQFLKKRNIWSKANYCNSVLQCQGKVENIFWYFKEDEIELKIQEPKMKMIFSWKFKRKNEDLKFTEQIVTLRHQKNSQTISLNLYPKACGK